MSSVLCSCTRDGEGYVEKESCEIHGDAADAGRMLLDRAQRDGATIEAARTHARLCPVPESPRSELGDWLAALREDIVDLLAVLGRKDHALQIERSAGLFWHQRAMRAEDKHSQEHSS